MEKIVNIKPTSPGNRFKKKIVNQSLYKGRPVKKLTCKKNKTAGRNNAGRITVRHKGGGHKRKYRIIDFKRDKDNISAKVIRIEYDPNRSANISLVQYLDGEKRYIISPKNLEVGMSIISGNKNMEVKIGNCMTLNNIPLGSTIHNIEMKPGKGAQIARSAGAYAQVITKEDKDKYVVIKLRSGEQRKILSSCKAVIGVVDNSIHTSKVIGKAGAQRWRNIRPTVRGVAMNPVDHPHGGGEGRTSGGNHPVTPWGKKTKGKKTRNNKRTDKFIVKKRK